MQTGDKVKRRRMDQNGENCICVKSPQTKLKHSLSIDTNDSESFSVRDPLSEIIIRNPSILQLQVENNYSSNPTQANNWNYNLISNYSVLDKIGRGTFGTVYKCLFLPGSHEIALKVINFVDFQPEYQENARAFYENEVSILRTLQQKSTFRLTCKFYGAFEHQGSGYIALELLQGFSLEELVQSEICLSLEDLKYYLAWLVLAMEQLHNMIKCVHRDIKPENLMILSNGEILLLDFGCAKFMKKHERTTSITGTCEYFSPSRFKCNYGIEADIWAFGVTAYELVTKKLPFCYPEIEKSQEEEKIIKLSSVLRKKSNMKMHELDCYDADFQEMIEGLFNSIFEEQESWHLEDLKKYRFFSLVQWDELRSHKIKPPRTFSLEEIQQIKQSSEIFIYF